MCCSTGNDPRPLVCLLNENEERKKRERKEKKRKEKNKKRERRRRSKKGAFKKGAGKKNRKVAEDIQKNPFH
jgi:hypothetical protein